MEKVQKLEEAHKRISKMTVETDPSTLDDCIYNLSELIDEIEKKFVLPLWDFFQRTPQLYAECKRKYKSKRVLVEGTKMEKTTTENP